MDRGIQDCGVDPIGYVRSNDLKVGDKVSVWWKPKGAVVIALLPYRGRFNFVHGIARISRDPTPMAPNPYAEMSLTDGMTFPIMP